MVGQPQDAPEFGWNVHSALNEWMAKVDSKASIVLSLEAVLFGFLISLTGEGDVFGRLRGHRLDFFRAGVGLLSGSVLLAAACVIPQLSRWKSRRGNEANHGLIYFGHLRHQTPESVSQKLQALTLGSDVDQLAAQLVEMSKIAWRKHSFLQISMVLCVIAVALLWWAGR